MSSSIPSMCSRTGTSDRDMSDESPRIGAIDSTSNGDLPAGAAIEHSAAEPVFVPRRRILRIGIWLAASVGFVAFALLARVSTHLGVEAVPWDKHGRDYVWRVWWRSRHKIVDLGPA